MNGGKSVAESREPQQLLSIAKEIALANIIRQMTVTGHPPKHSLILKLADELRQHRLSGVNDDGAQ